MFDKEDNLICTAKFDRVYGMISVRTIPKAGEGKKIFTASLGRRHQDKNGRWGLSTHYNERDLPHLQKAARWCHHELLRRRQEGGSD